MRRRLGRVVGMCFLLAAPGAGGPASALECTADAAAHMGNAPFLCGDTFSRATAEGAEGSNGTSGVTFYLNLAGGTADNYSSGTGGLAGSAVAEASFGELHAFASADNGSWTEAVVTAESRVISTAEAAFADRGLLTSPTLPDGSPVQLLFTMRLEGAVVGGSGMETFTVATIGAPSTFVEKTALLFEGSGFTPPPFTYDAAVGDEINFKLELAAAAGSTNLQIVHTSGIADFSSSGGLAIEVLTPDVALETASQHDYAPVPEPAQAALLASGAVALALASRIGPRRRLGRDRWARTAARGGGEAPGPAAGGGVR